jgi:hypothetical protein
MTMERKTKAKHQEQLNVARTSLRGLTGAEHQVGPKAGHAMSAADYVKLRMPGRRPSTDGRAGERKLAKMGYEPTARGGMVKRIGKILGK